ncbi:MAG TPA: tetratricopeptide repeat protein [Pyrinomonadaceae bacterium]|nr:tetratricopeptide repeat protein [Pyrinomonadaceae bacterium]
MERSPERDTRLYHFGPFCLDAGERVLLRDGRLVPLPAKALSTLLTLVLSRGQLVEKDVLIQRVWPDEFVEEGNLSQHIFMLRKALGETAGNAKYIETVPRRGYRFVAPVSEHLKEFAEVANPAGKRVATKKNTQQRLVDIPSIAVLPFETLGATTQDEYLGLGIADALITRLSKLRKVKVRPTSAVRNAVKDDAVSFGRALKVATVLEGTIQKWDEYIRVTVQLVSIRDGATLWAERFDEKFTNIFAIEDSISEQAAAALTVKLTAEEQEQLVKRYTENTQAHQAYLKGRYFFERRTQDGLAKSIEYFESAIRLDPYYAIAYAGLAECYCMLVSFDLVPPRDSMPKAKEAALKAISIEPNLAEAHAALGWILLNDWEWTAAEREFKLAIELNPNYATGHHYYAIYLRHMRRFDRSLAETRKVQELDPTSAGRKATEGVTLYCAGRYAEAIEELRRALELDANSTIAHYGLARIHAQRGMYDAAITEYERTMSLFGKSPELLSHLGYVYAVSGKRDAAKKMLEELEESANNGYVPSFYRALIYVGLDQKEQALEWLEQAYQEHDVNLVSLAVEPTLASLREDPRFTRLLQLMRLLPHLLETQAN